MSAARLESFTEEEKKELASLLGRKLLMIGGIYIVVLLISVGLLIYFNRYSENFYFQNNLEVINVAFVVIAVICGRLFVSELLEYTKEIKSPHKKVVETKVLAVKDGSIRLGNKSFEEDDFLFGVPDFDSLQAGDAVRVELSAKTDTLFSLQRV